ncbi:MAG: hypothetical protein WC121_05055 [Candidatus Kapaibacterium sp.]
MKKIIMILSLVLVFACSDDGGMTDEKFIQIYQEVLVARESTVDREAGTSKVNEVFEKYNISEPEFQKIFFKMAKEKPKRLAEMMDSIRIQTEVQIRNIDSTKKASEMEKDTNSASNSDK